MTRNWPRTEAMIKAKGGPEAQLLPIIRAKMLKGGKGRTSQLEWKVVLQRARKLFLRFLKRALDVDLSLSEAKRLTTAARECDPSFGAFVFSVICQACGKHGTLTCQGCDAAKYCSVACQKKDWRRHKPVCQAATKTGGGK